LEGSSQSGGCLSGGSPGDPTKLREMVFRLVTETKPRNRDNTKATSGDRNAPKRRKVAVDRVVRLKKSLPAYRFTTDPFPQNLSASLPFPAFPFLQEATGLFYPPQASFPAAEMDDGNATPPPTILLNDFTSSSFYSNHSSSSWSSSSSFLALSPAGGSRFFIVPEELTPSDLNVTRDDQLDSNSAMELVAHLPLISSDELPQFMVNQFVHQNLSFDPDTIFKNDVDVGDLGVYDYWSWQLMNEQFADITLPSNNSTSTVAGETNQSPVELSDQIDEFNFEFDNNLAVLTKMR
jgi:hypothetical protein